MVYMIWNKDDYWNQDWKMDYLIWVILEWKDISIFGWRIYFIKWTITPTKDTEPWTYDDWYRTLQERHFIPLGKIWEQWNQ